MSTYFTDMCLVSLFHSIQFYVEKYQVLCAPRKVAEIDRGKEEFTFQNRRPVFLAKLVPVKCRIPKGIGKLLKIPDSSVCSAHF